MKKLVFVMTLLAATAGHGQKADVPTGVRLSPGADVPSIVRERFREEFPKVNAGWQNLGDEGFLAVFQDDSTRLPRRVLYTSTGQKVESHARRESGGYPAIIDQHFLNNAPTSKFIVWQYTAHGSSPTYYAVAGADTTWFGSGGEFHEQKNRAKAPPSPGRDK